MTPQQQAIQDAVRRLNVALDAVPDSTIHYAVEEARRALRVLDRQVVNVKTSDVALREQAAAEVASGRKKA